MTDQSKSIKAKDLKIFIVAGRLGKTLTVSKTIPFTLHPNVSKVYIFRQEEGFYIQGAQYITLPNIILKLKPSFLQKIIRFIWEPLQLIYFSFKLEPDLINGVFTLPKGLNAVIAAKISESKSIVSVIGGVIEITTRLPFQAFWKGVNLKMLNTSDAVTTKGSKVTAYLINKGVFKEKIFNLNGSIDISTFYIDESIEKDIDILFVGTFRKLKGPDRVVEVVNNLVRQDIDVKAALLGDGYLFNAVQDQIKDMGLQNCVKLAGYQANPVKYFQRAKVILLPSKSEGLPTVMLEAMACGCVPVVSDVGNITDAAKHEENAMVLNHWNDIEGFAEASKKLLENDTFREKLSEEGRKTVEERYSPEKQSEVVDKILEYLELN